MLLTEADIVMRALHVNWDRSLRTVCYPSTGDSEIRGPNPIELDIFSIYNPIFCPPERIFLHSLVSLCMRLVQGSPQLLAMIIPFEHYIPRSRLRRSYWPP